MNNKRLVFFIIIFVGAFFIGYSISSNLEPVFYPSTGPNEFATMQDRMPDTNQLNVLIVGMNSDETADPELISVWLGAYLPSSSKVSLVPVFPLSHHPLRNQKVAAAFALDTNGKLSDSFLETLEETGAWWNGYLLLDNQASAHLINDLGGILVQDTHQDGDAVIANLPSWHENPQLAVESQKTVFEGICSQINNTSDISARRVINELTARRIRAELPMQDLFRSWRFLSRNQASLLCEFPTFELQAYQSPQE